ncbi:MAG: hypothetical protein KatS3mg023_3147 [Armatimonadota bacterium]|nr:MAG: hypothetical protein KatS3mg023_3147 [Armatimonadota bacterium]
MVWEITYGPKYKVAYIRFRTADEQVETIRLSDEVLVDITSDGTIWRVGSIRKETMSNCKETER